MSYSGDLSTKTGKINFKLTHNKKHNQSILFISFTTSQKELLTMLLQKYVAEKCLVSGFNPNNMISSASVGETSIVMAVPEMKLLTNISILISYLNKTSLSNLEASYLTKEINYDTLMKDIGSFNVIITGKCKGMIASFEKKAPKIDMFVKSLDRYEPKKRTMVVKKPKESSFGKSFKFSESKEAQLYLAICLERIPYTMKGNNVVLLSPHADVEIIDKYVHSDIFRAKIKSFLGQSGAFGSPASNDTGGVKHAQRKKDIMTCQNELASIYSKLRGFNFSFAKEDQIKSVDTQSLKAVREFKLE